MKLLQSHPWGTSSVTDSTCLPIITMGETSQLHLLMDSLTHLQNDCFLYTFTHTIFLTTSFYAKWGGVASLFIGI